MRSPPRLTAELFTIPLDVAGAYLVYAPLRRAAFIANASAVNRIMDFAEGGVEGLAAEDEALAAFLHVLEIVDGGAEPAAVTAFAGDPRPTEVTLFLTTTCNLRCSYCYASAGDTPKKVMGLDVARRGIDFVSANAAQAGRPAFTVLYHGGGEPTGNWATLTGSHEYARLRAERLGLRLESSIATNGVLSDPHTEWLIAHLDSATVSFDGAPEVQDAHRLTVLGQGSSHRVERTLRRFDAEGFPYGVRMTVTREQIPRMAESVRYVCENFRPTRILIEPAYQLGRWRDQPSAETEGFLAGFRAAREIARDAGHVLSFSGARLGTLSNHFCGISQDAFCLTADGTVSACYETFLEENEWARVFHYGCFDEPSGAYRFQLPVLNHLRSQTVDRREFCAGCFAKWSCGGDCLHKALSVNGEGEFAGTDRCHLIRELTKDQILEKVRESGGIFWHELDPDAADLVAPPEGEVSP